jgi:hypothetical protein
MPAFGFTHNAGKDLPFTRQCRVCGMEEWQWNGYVRGKDGRYDCFCETCKEKFIRFAQQYGVKFGWLGKGKHNACPENVSREEIGRLWNIFVKRKIWLKGLKERVQFT